MSSFAYVCQACGTMQQAQFLKCPACREWDRCMPCVPADPAPAGGGGDLEGDGRAGPVPISIADAQAEVVGRILTGIAPLDVVLGGGLAEGSVVHLSGSPGVGKSSLAMQAADGLAAGSGRVLYASSEETVGQVKDRADRFGVIHRDRVFLLYEARVEAILARCPAGGSYAALIVDSAQTATADGGAPGTLKTVVEVARRLVSHAKRTGLPVILVGHVTKDGEAAGPNTLMHLVDVVLSIEGDPKRPDRILTAAKNRFGSTAVEGRLHMTEAGLVVPPDLG